MPSHGRRWYQFRYALRAPLHDTPLRWTRMVDRTHKKRNHVSMKTNIDLDERLVSRAQKLTGLKTKKEIVNHALSELVRKKDQKSILRLKGRIAWTGDLEKLRESRF